MEMFARWDGNLPNAEFIGHLEITGADPYTFTVSLGTPVDINDFIVVNVGLGAALNSPTVTIGGIGATAVVSPIRFFNQFRITPAQLATLGGTTNIVVSNLGTTGVGCGISLWRLSNCSPTPAAIASDVTSVTSSPANVSLNTLENEIIIAGAVMHFSPTRTATWAGINEEFDIEFVPTTDRHSGGEFLTTTTETPRTITATPSGTTNTYAIASRWQSL